MRGIFATLALIATPASAEVQDAGATGFVSAHQAILDIAPADVWTAVVAWQSWWPDAHSYSGKAPTLELRAGGALAERWAGGEVLHATVVNLQTSRLLRLRGEFGPLQSMPVTAVLDIAIEPESKGTKLTMHYRVAGSAPALTSIAKPVDGVMAEGFARLVAVASRTKNTGE